MAYGPGRTQANNVKRISTKRNRKERNGKNDQDESDGERVEICNRMRKRMDKIICRYTKTTHKIIKLRWAKARAHFCVHVCVCRIVLYVRSLVAFTICELNIYIGKAQTDENYTWESAHPQFPGKFYFCLFFCYFTRRKSTNQTKPTEEASE